MLNHHGANQTGLKIISYSGCFFPLEGYPIFLFPISSLFARLTSAMISCECHALETLNAKSSSNMKMQMQPYEGANENLYLVMQMPFMRMQMRILYDASVCKGNISRLFFFPFSKTF